MKHLRDQYLNVSKGIFLAVTSLLHWLYNNGLLFHSHLLFTIFAASGTYAAFHFAGMYVYNNFLWYWINPRFDLRGKWYFRAVGVDGTGAAVITQTANSINIDAFSAHSEDVVIRTFEFDGKEGYIAYTADVRHDHAPTLWPNLYGAATFTAHRDSHNKPPRTLTFRCLEYDSVQNTFQLLKIIWIRNHEDLYKTADASLGEVLAVPKALKSIKRSRANRADEEQKKPVERGHN